MDFWLVLKICLLESHPPNVLLINPCAALLFQAALSTQRVQTNRVLFHASTRTQPAISQWPGTPCFHLIYFESITISKTSIVLACCHALCCHPTTTSTACNGAASLNAWGVRAGAVSRRTELWTKIHASFPILVKAFIPPASAEEQNSHPTLQTPSAYLPYTKRRI